MVHWSIVLHFTTINHQELKCAIVHIFSLHEPAGYLWWLLWTVSKVLTNCPLTVRRTPGRRYKYADLCMVWCFYSAVMRTKVFWVARPRWLVFYYLHVRETGCFEYQGIQIILNNPEDGGSILLRNVNTVDAQLKSELDSQSRRNLHCILFWKQYVH